MSEEDPLMDLLECPAQLIALLRRAADEDSDDIAAAVEDELAEAWTWLVQSTKLPPTNQDPKKRQEIQAARGIQYSDQRVEEILTLADYLHLDEDVCIRLLEGSDLPQAVFKYHQLIAHRLDVLRLIFDRNELPADGALFEVLEDEAAALVNFRDEKIDQTTVKSFYHSIIDAVESCEQLIQESLDGDKRIPSTVAVGLEVAVFRVQSLRTHQRALMNLLNLVASRGELDVEHLAPYMHWLSARKTEDGVTVMGLTAFLSAMQPVMNAGQELNYDDFSERVKQYVEQPDAVRGIYVFLDQAQFALPWVSSIMLLAFVALFDKARDRLAEQGRRLDIPREGPKDVETAYKQVMSRCPLDDLRLRVIPSAETGYWNDCRQRRKAEMAHAGDEATIKRVRTEDTWPEVESVYQRATLRQVDLLVKGLLVAPSRPVKQFFKWQSDSLRARVKNRDVKLRSDFNSYVELVVALYQELPPDHDDQFWDGIRVISPLSSVQEVPGLGGVLNAKLLRAIGNGKFASSRLHQHLLESDARHLSWKDILLYMHDISLRTSSILPPSAPALLNKDDGPSAEEETLRVLCLEEFLVIVRTVLDWHPSALHSLPSGPDLDLTAVLLQLVNRALPPATRSQVLLTLAAVSEAAKGIVVKSVLGSVHDRIVKEMHRLTWGHDSNTISPWLLTLHGTMAEPFTTGIASFAHLLGTVISVQPSESMSNPPALWSTFKHKTLEYVLKELPRPPPKQSPNDVPVLNIELQMAVLRFVHSILSSWPVEELLGTEAGDAKAVRAANQRRLQSLCQHPAFDVITRVLAGGYDDLRNAIYKPLLDRRSLETDALSPEFEKLRIATQILSTVLAKQDYFLQILVPHQRPSLSLTSLDQRLASSSQLVTRVAESVSPSLPADIALAALQILRKLGQSPLLISSFFVGGKQRFGNVVYRILSDAEATLLPNFISMLTPRPIDALTHRLETMPAKRSSVGERRRYVALVADQQRIPSTLIDMLTEQTTAGSPSPNLAHLLLGLPQKINPRPTCLEALAESLRFDAGGEIFHQHPTLASKSLRLLLNLTRNEATSDRTTRYLRNQLNFVDTALAQLPTMASEGLGLDCQATILELAAVELHLLAPKSTWAHRVVASFVGLSERETQQGPPLATQLLLTWANTKWPASDVPEVLHFQSLNVDDFRSTADDGTTTYDISRISSALKQESQRLIAKSPSIGQDGRLEREIQSILSFLTTENAKLEQAAATRLAIEAWAKLLEVTLNKNIGSIPQEQRVRFIFKVANTCFQWLAVEDLPVHDLAAAFSQPIFAISVALRGNANASPDVLSSFFHHIATLLADVQTSEASRGFYYSAAINVLRHAESRGLNLGSPALLQRLFGIICKDALHGSQIWQTVSYTSLDVLMANMGDSQAIIDELDRSGFLQNVVRSLQESDRGLQALMDREDADDNILYVYEAKIAFLLRLSQGANCSLALIRSGLFEMLSRLEIFSRRPLGGADGENQNAAFLRSTERYHHVTLPLFQLVAQVTSSAMVDAYQPCGRFLAAQSQSLLALLSDQNSPLTLAAIDELRHLSNTIWNTIQAHGDARTSVFDVNAYISALKGLVGRFTDPSRWVPALSALTDAEQRQMRSRAPFEQISSFQSEARDRVVSLLRDNLSRFAASVNDGAHGSLFTAGGQLGAESSSRRLAASCAPLSHAVALLSACTDDLALASSTIADIKVLLDRSSWADLDLDQYLAELGFEGKIEDSQAEVTERLRDILQAKEDLADDLLSVIESLSCLTYKHLTLYDGLLTDELKKTRRFVDPRSSDKADKELASRWKADLAQASGSAAEAAQGLMDASLLDTLFDSEDGRERKALLEMLLQRLAHLKLQNSSHHAA